MSVDHWRLWLKELRDAGPVPGKELPADFRQRLADAEKEVADREKAFDLPGRVRRFREDSARHQGATRARRALALGLVKPALEALSRPSSPGSASTDLQVGLLLSTGQADEIRDDEAARNDWHTALRAAARGDYPAADEALAASSVRRARSVTGRSCPSYVALRHSKPATRRGRRSIFGRCRPRGRAIPTGRIPLPCPAPRGTLPPLAPATGETLTANGPPRPEAAALDSALFQGRGPVKASRRSASLS